MPMAGSWRPQITTMGDVKWEKVRTILRAYDRQGALPIKNH